MSKRSELRAQRRAEYNANRVELVKTRQELRVFKKENAPKKIMFALFLVCFPSLCLLFLLFFLLVHL